MSKSSLFSLLSVAALSLGLTIPAGAVTITVGGSGTAPAGSTGITFGASNSVSGGGVTSSSFTGGAATTNVSVTNLDLDPLSGPGYFAYTPQNPAGTLTLNFAAGINDLYLLWGSPDGSNQITFSGPSGSVTVTGTSASASGLVLNAQTSQWVNIALGGTYTSATFSSGINSFEFGSVADVAAPSPEPASIALLAGGLLAIGAGAIRRRKSN